MGYRTQCFPCCCARSFKVIAYTLPKFTQRSPDTSFHKAVTYEMKEITGGKYYHFGIAKGVSEKLRTENLSMDVQLLHLQINIDGLPLHKSSKTQFWPVLGRIIELEDSTPFIIGLFSGEQKPGHIEEYLHD